MISNPASVALLRECRNPRSCAALPGLRDVISDIVWKYMNPPSYTFMHFVVICGQAISIVFDKSRYGFYYDGRYAGLYVVTNPPSGAVVSMEIYSIAIRRGIIQVDCTIDGVKHRGTIPVELFMRSMSTGAVVLEATKCDYPTEWRYISGNRKFCQIGLCVYRKADLAKRTRVINVSRDFAYYSEDGQWYAMRCNGQLFRLDILDVNAPTSMMIGPGEWM